jgi:RNA polymerase sigma-70 factor (ECF subfamily)
MANAELRGAARASLIAVGTDASSAAWRMDGRDAGGSVLPWSDARRERALPGPNMTVDPRQRRPAWTAAATPRREPSADGHALDDAALARLAAERNPRAAALIWDRFSPVVRRVIRRAVGPSGDVEDIVQEVFLKLFDRADTLRDPGALRHFVLSIATSVLVSELRRRRVRRYLGLLTADGELPERGGHERDDDARELVGRVYAVLDRVRDGDRLAFVLKTIEGLELTEVAAAMNTSVATVKRRVARVHARLQRLAEQEPSLASYVGGLRR